MSGFILGALAAWLIVIPAIVFLVLGLRYRAETRDEREQEQEARNVLYGNFEGWRT